MLSKNNLIVFTSTAFTRGLGALSLIFFTISVAGKFDSLNAGIFFLSHAIHLFCLNIGKWGTDISLCRYLANQDFKTNPNIFLKYLSNAFFLIIFRCTFIFIILFTLQKNNFFEDSNSWGASFYLSLFLNSIIIGLAGIFQSIRSINTYILYQSVLVPFLSSLLIFILPVKNINHL